MKFFNAFFDVMYTAGGILLGVTVLASFLWFLNKMGFNKIKLLKGQVDISKPDPVVMAASHISDDTVKLCLKAAETGGALLDPNYRTTHMTCSLSKDLHDIVKLVRHSSWNAMDILRMKTRAQQMGAIDGALDSYKKTLEREYLSHYKRVKSKNGKVPVDFDEMQNAKLVYHIMSDSLIRKLMNELRKFISDTSPFDAGDNEEKWRVNRSKLIDNIFHIIKIELDDYFPRRYMADCENPSEFLNEFRKDTLKTLLEGTLDECRLISLRGRQKYESILDEMDLEIIDYARGNGDCEIDAVIERQFIEGLKKASRSL